MTIYPERGKWVVRMNICGTEEFIADTREEALALARNRINEALTAVLSATDYMCGGWAESPIECADGTVREQCK